MYPHNRDRSGSPGVEYPGSAVGDPSIKGTALELKLLLTPRELLSGECVNAILEITCRWLGDGMLEALESAAPRKIEPTSASSAVLDEKLIEPRCLKIDPFRTYRLSLSLGSRVAEKVEVGPRSAVIDESGNGLKNVILPSETLVLPVTPIMEFLARAFAEDYLQRRLSFEQSGWRGLMHIVDSLKVPKSHAYGEARYGHTFGRPLETLIKAGIVEYRIFRGKGRGGNVVRVRACYEMESVKRLVNGLVANASANSVGDLHEEITKGAEVARTV